MVLQWYPNVVPWDLNFFLLESGLHILQFWHMVRENFLKKLKTEKPDVIARFWMWVLKIIIFGLLYMWFMWPEMRRPFWKIWRRLMYRDIPHPSKKLYNLAVKTMNINWPFQPIEIWNSYSSCKHDFLSQICFQNSCLSYGILVIQQSLFNPHDYLNVISVTKNHEQNVQSLAEYRSLCIPILPFDIVILREFSTSKHWGT